MRQSPRSSPFKHRASFALIAFLLLVTIGIRTAAATTDNESGFLAITEENDSFGNPFGPHQDRHYTQGLKISLFGGDNFMTNVSARLNDLLPAWGFRPQAGDFGWIILGQDIYTPTNLLSRAPIPTDRPYAGLKPTPGVLRLPAPRRHRPEPSHHGKF